MKAMSRCASVASVCALLFGQACTESPTAPQSADSPASFAKVKSLTMTELVRPAAWGDGQTHAKAVSDKGQVVGTWLPPSGWPSKGFSWENGQFTDLGDFWPNDVNDKGQMVGYSGTAGNVLWDHGVTTTLPGSAVAINNLGHVVGTLVSNGHPYLWRDGVTTDLGSMRTVPPYTIDYSEVVDVNDHDQVVGRAGIGYWWDPFRAFFWENGTWTALGTGAENDEGHSDPTGINNEGLVVGMTTSAAYTYIAFLWQDGQMTMIGSTPGLNWAAAVDDDGVISGGCYAIVDSAWYPFPCLYYEGAITELPAPADSYTTRVIGMSDKGKFILGDSESVGAWARPVLWSK